MNSCCCLNGTESVMTLSESFTASNKIDGVVVHGCKFWTSPTPANCRASVTILLQKVEPVLDEGELHKKGHV